MGGRVRSNLPDAPLHLTATFGRLAMPARGLVELNSPSAKSGWNRRLVSSRISARDAPHPGAQNVNLTKPCLSRTGIDAVPPLENQSAQREEHTERSVNSDRALRSSSWLLRARRQEASMRRGRGNATRPLARQAPSAVRQRRRLGPWGFAGPADCTCAIGRDAGPGSVASGSATQYRIASRRRSIAIHLPRAVHPQAWVS
jgi:hypothetical protein